MRHGTFCFPLNSAELQLNCVTLIMQNEMFDSTSTLQALDTVDDVLLGIFVFEMVVKVVAFGLISTGPRAYLRDSWNVFDSVIVTLG